MEDFTYVDTEHALAVAVAAMREAPVIGFDTEFVGEATYEPTLCLLQVATDRAIWLIDPRSAIALDEFWSVLTEPGKEIVALAARQEVLFCLRYVKRPPSLVFDPQLAAGLVGLGYPLSYTNLVQQVLGVGVRGGETFTEWRQRPLSPRQLAYAAEDVRHLLAMREQLLARAKSKGREDWLRGEAEALVERIVRSDGGERWQRATGAGSLSPRGLAVLRELWHWRESAARRAALPARRILGDDLLVEIAKRSPRTVADLFALRGFDRPALRQSGSELVGAVQAGLAVPESELPPSLRRNDPPQLTMLSQLASIVVSSLAAQNSVDLALLATTGDVQEFVRWYLAGSEHEPPAMLKGWRGELVSQPLMDLLGGKSGIRVGNVRAANPLNVELM